MKKFISVGALIFLLAACQTTDDFVGSGPITLSPAIADHFQNKYLTGAGPAHYVIPSDGVSGAYYSYCPSGPGTCQFDLAVIDSINHCERDTGQKCYVFAEGEEVVWKGPVKFYDGTLARRAWKDFKSRNLQSSGTITDLSDAALCVLAFSNGKLNEEDNARKYVEEANSRNLNDALCNRRTDASRSNTFVPHANLSDAHVCHFALSQISKNLIWARSSSHIKYVNIAKDRGFSPQDCYKINLEKN